MMRICVSVEAELHGHGLVCPVDIGRCPAGPEGILHCGFKARVARRFNCNIHHLSIVGSIKSQNNVSVCRTVAMGIGGREKAGVKSRLVEPSNGENLQVQ